MKIEGYNLVSICTAHEAAILMVACQDDDVELQPIFGNDAMWHYMTTGQVLEGNENGRAEKEGTNQQ